MSPGPLLSARSPFPRRYNAANSAPQRSQYHSVGRLRAPHSPHLRVLTAVWPAGLASTVAGELPADAAMPALRPPVWGTSSVIDLRKVSSSTPAPPGPPGCGVGIGIARVGP